MWKTLTKISTISLLPLWVALGIFEAASYKLVNPKPVFHRAWETAINIEGKDSHLAPFKPLYTYYGTATGSTTPPLHFKPNQSEILPQEFIVDEYGFRNPVGFLKKGVEAVVFGNSHVAGAAETQEYLVSTLLTEKYNIRTYNHSSTPLQLFWQNEWFRNNPPKYVIVLGTEKEVRESNWIETLVDDQSTPTYSPKQWQSQEQWKNENLPAKSLKEQLLGFNYDQIAHKLRVNSITRYLVNKVHTEIVNRLFTRYQLAIMYGNKDFYYEPSLDMAFYQVEEDNPELTPKVMEDIKTAMVTLTQTRDILNSRGITLIVVPVPTKGYLYYPGYQNIPYENLTITKLEQELDKHQIQNVKLHNIFLEEAKKTGDFLYYSDDTHWSARANIIISKAVAQKIQELSELKTTTSKE